MKRLATRWAQVILGLLLFYSPCNSRAGHDLMIPVGVYDFAAEPVPKKNQWVTFGVPVPAWAQLRDVSNLVLVGATVSQVDILATWPNGCARWLAVDAIVDLPEDADRVGLHLTTGQAPEGFAPIAKESEDGIVIDSGDLRFTVSRDGKLPVGEVFRGQERVAEGLSELLNISRAEVEIEKNGPARATVLIRDGEISHRVSLAFGSSCIHLESSFAAEAEGSGSLFILNTDTPVFAPNEWLENWGIPTYRSRIGTLGGRIPVYWSSMSEPWLYPTDIKGFGNPAPYIDRIGKPRMPQGAWTRQRIIFDFSGVPESEARLKAPLTAKALTIHAYNDADTLSEWVGQTKATALDQKDLSFEDIVFALYRFLGDTNPNPKAGLFTMRQAIEYALSRGQWETEFPGEAISLYAMLANDMGILEAYRDWGAREFVESQPILDDKGVHLDEIAQRVDYLSLFEGSNQDTTQAFWESFLSSYMDPSGQSVLIQSGRRGSRYLLGLAHKIWGARLTTPLPGAVDDLLLPAFEIVVGQQMEKMPNDLAFRAGYYLTGDAQFIRDGAVWLEAHPESPHAPSLRSFLENYQRSIHWKTLPDIDVRKVSKGTFQLAWTGPEDLSPPSSLEGYFEPFHVRVHSKPLTTELRSQLMATPAPFWLGRWVPLQGEWREFGSNGFRIQTPVRQLNDEGPLYFAGRYLARGPDLPVLKPEPGTEAVASGDVFSLLPWLPWIGGGALMVALVMGVWGRKRQRRSSVASLLCALIMLGCGGPEGGFGSNSAQTDGGTYRVSWWPTADAVPFNDHFSILATVTAIDGTDLPQGLSLEVDADMPAHGHGIHTQPRVRFLGENRFQVDGLLLHMLGEWEIYIDVVDGFVRERAVFPLTL